MNYHKEVYQIALTKVDGIGPVTGKLLLDNFESAYAVFQASESEINTVVGLKKGIHALIHRDKEIFAQAEEELQISQKYGIDILFYQDEDFPNRLKHCPDAPLVLYHKGNNSFNSKRTIGIVGTRNPSYYSKEMVDKLVKDLAVFNPIIVSGLAHGVDALAHSASLENEIPTYGIMGGGFENIYPAANRDLARKMLKDGGLMTEFGFHSLPDREHFPMRNRIIAALSDALIVVESGRTGGSMITADLANQYSKDVFAFPGKVDDKMSIGCNRLIKQNQAHLIESADDIAYIMGWHKPKEVQMTLPLVTLDAKEQSVVNLLTASKGVHLDKIHHELNLPISSLSPLLLSLEFRGIIRSLPGKCYTIN